MIMEKLQLLGVLVLFGFIGAVTLLSVVGVLTIITKLIKRYLK